MTAYISKQLNTKEQPHHLWALLGVIIILAALYGYFLNTAIVSVVARESLQDKISLVSSNVGVLESKLLTAERPLTSDAVATYGLSIPKEVSYLNQTGAGTILTFGRNI